MQLRKHQQHVQRHGPRLSFTGIRLCLLCLAIAILAQIRAGVVDRWVFARTNVTGSLVTDLAGNLPGTIQGTFSWSSDPEALVLDGSQCYVRLAEPIDTNLLPRTNITVEAWVAMRSAGYYPGIAGCIQDNGSYERGWWLGADGGKFGFALAADTTLTYLWAPTTYQMNRWYHVAATYDGTTMRLFVNGAAVATSTAERGNINYAPAPAVLGAYKDDNEIHPMDGFLREVALHDKALAAAQVAALYTAQKDLFPDIVTPTNSPTVLTVALGPYVRFTAVSNAVVCWETATPQPSILEYGNVSPPGRRVIASTNLTLSHNVDLGGLEPRSTYYYRLVTATNGMERATEIASFETDFNYSPQALLPDLNPYPDAGDAAKLAQAILQQTGVFKGYALDYGAADGALAYELALRSDLNVMVVSPDAQAVDQIRRKLQAAGVYGTRVTALATSLDKLPYTRDWFNLVVSSGLVARGGGTVPGTGAEAWRVLRPDGGVALLGLPNGVDGKLAPWNALNRWAELGIPAGESTMVTDANRSLMVTKARKTGAGEWTHNYGDPGQTASSGDQRVKGRSMRVQWFGDPGARGFTDRQARNPTPLMAGGTLYSQGNDRIAAQDAYNGRLLWSLEVPGLRRVNMPRDGGNWCADDTSLFVTLRQKLLRLSRRDGSLLASYETSTAPATHDWGCVASIGDRVYGTSIKSGAFYTKWDGTWDYWYDSTTSMAEIAKLVSDDLFCLAKANGALLWKYTNSAIINTSLAFGGGRVYFVESRNPTMLNYGSGRADTQALWTNLFMVALDAATGSRLWDRALTEVAVNPYPIVFYLSYADEKLVITDSTTRYFVYGYSAKDGAPAWSKNHAWKRNHHGSHMYHPVIAGKNLIVEPYVYNLDTGAVVRSDLPERGGCSTMSAAANCVHYINWDYSKGAPYFWDLDTNERRQMAGTRASCWLSMISGGGMVTILPGSAGCACRFPIQSTLAWGAP